jgi:anti-sigma factor RsiW
MPCHRTRLMLLPYLHGQLAPIAAQEISSHLAGCAACAGEEALLREEMDCFRMAVRVQAPAGLHSGVMRRLESVRLPAATQGASAGPRRVLRATALVAASLALTITGLAFIWPAAGDALVNAGARLGSQLLCYAGERSLVWPGLMRAAETLWDLAGL